MLIKGSVISGIKWTTFSAVILAVLQVCQLAILSRFIDPADFGLMAILMVVIGFAQIFLDVGMSNAIIYYSTITRSQLSSLYWVNILMALLLTVIVIAIAPYVSKLYDEPRMILFLKQLSLVFILGGMGSQYRVLCQKELMFDKISKIEVLSSLVSFVVVVILAVQGFGLYSLIYSTLINVALSSILYMGVGFYFFGAPAFVFEIKGLRNFFSFGFFQLGERLFIYSHSQFDVLLIGKFFGVEATGIYSMAKMLIVRVVGIVVSIVSRVTLPIMSKNNDDLMVLKMYYLNSVKYLSLIVAPIFLFISVLSSPIVQVLFGHKWVDVIPVLQILSFYGFFRVIGNPIGSLILAKGRADIGFYWNLSMLFFIPFAVLCGRPFGLEGVSCALLVMAIVLKLPEYYFIAKPLSGVSFSGYFGAFSKPILMVIFVGFALLPIMGISNIYYMSFSALFFGLLMYLSMLFLFEPKLRRFMSYRYLKTVLQK